MILSKVLFKLRVPRYLPSLMPIFTLGRMEPSFFIVGFQKCGTTSLYDLLMSHPNVLPGLLKENNFISEKNERLVEFRASFPYKQAGKITGDASHLHTWAPYGLTRIKEYFPNAKIIILMRDPISRAHSHFNMDKKIGYIPSNLSFDSYIDIELKLIESISNKNDLSEIYFGTKLFGNRYGWALSRGVYHVYLSKILDLQLDHHCMFMEELNADHLEKWQGLLQFLSIDSYVPKFKVSNKGDYENSIAPETRARLREFYSIPNQELKLMLNRELPWS